MNVLMIVGSLRDGSWTRQVAHGLSGLLPQGVHSTTFDDLGALPHYDQDLDVDQAPAAVVALREAITDADALVVATPEYNGSVPGVLKNAIDWASRPRGASALAGKPVAVVSVSPSPRGAQWARQDLVRVLGVTGATVLGEGVGVATVHDVLDDGRIADPAVRRALEGLASSLASLEAPRAA